MAAIGTAACRVCEREIPIKENERGTQNWGCAHCDVSLYVKKGTEAHRTLQARLKRNAPPPAGDPAPSAPPAAAKSARVPFKMPGT